MGGWGWRAVLLTGALTALSGCASGPLSPAPTETRPRTGCYIACPDGYFSRVQHLCRAGKRQFEEVRVYGENVERNVDGTKKVDQWKVIVYTTKGPAKELRDKVDVVLQACSDYIRSIVLAREPDKRGLHPGEHDYSKPPK